MYDPTRCWADPDQVATWDSLVAMYCRRPATTDIGLCDDHHAAIVGGHPCPCGVSAAVTREAA